MKRYWFEFEDGNFSYNIKIGCGVTAYNYEDALYLLKERLFKGTSLPRIRAMIENVDISTLDPDHVLPNMSAPNLRGIWFPLGCN